MRSLPNQIDVTTFPTNKQPSSHVTDEWKKNSSKTRESIDAACEPRARRCLQIYIKDCLRARCDISGNTCCSFLLTKDWCFHFPFNETYIHSWIAEKSSRHRARLPRRTIRQAFNNKRERTRKRLTSHADENPAFQQARSPQPRVLSNFFALRSPVYDFPVMSRRSRAFASPQSLLTTDRTTRHSVPLFLCLFSFPPSHSLSLSVSLRRFPTTQQKFNDVQPICIQQRVHRLFHTARSRKSRASTYRRITRFYVAFFFTWMAERRFGKIWKKASHVFRS